MDTILGLLLTILGANTPALIILWWVKQERDERIAERERHYRLLLALAGYETDPDDKKVIRILPDRSVQPPNS